MTAEETLKGSEEKITLTVEKSYECVNDLIRDLISRIATGRALLYDEVTLSITYCESKIISLTPYLYDKSIYHINRAYFHASPGFIALLAAIWGVIQTVAKVIEWVMKIIQILQALHIDDLLFRIFPEFKKAWDDLMNKISNFSQQLGWGVDGVLHLLNAVDASAGLFGGLTGKGDSWGEIKFVTNAQGVMSSISDRLEKFQDNPGAAIAELFGEISRSQQRDARGEFYTKWTYVNNMLDRTVEATKQIGTITDEISSIQENMPQVVAKYIPQSIWDGINRADSYINDTILPGLMTIEKSIESVNKLIDINKNNLRNIVHRIAFPGDLLSDVDKLSDRFREYQEAKIHDVASRQFGRDIDKEYEELTGTINEFEKVSEALKAPTPEPEFLSIESPERAALTGIIEEPRETWFVGDF